MTSYVRLLDLYDIYRSGASREVNVTIITIWDATARQHCSTSRKWPTYHQRLGRSRLLIGLNGTLLPDTNIYTPPKSLATEKHTPIFLSQICSVTDTPANVTYFFRPIKVTVEEVYRRYRTFSREMRMRKNMHIFIVLAFDAAVFVVPAVRWKIPRLSERNATPWHSNKTVVTRTRAYKLKRKQ